MKYITLILILVNVVFFVIEPKISGTLVIDINHPFSQLLAFTPSQAFNEPWTFVTSTFLHADLRHLFFNMFALFFFGIFLEGRVKATTFLTIYFLAGIVGNFGYMITTFNPEIPGVGASGAVYGLIGSLAVIAPFALVYMGFAPMPMILAAVIYGLIEFLGLFVPSGIARGAHLGGLIIGIAYGFYLRAQIKKYENQHRVRYRLA